MEISLYIVFVFRNINICAIPDYLLLLPSYKYLDMMWSWNLHWGYSLANKLVNDFVSLPRDIFQKCVLICKLHNDKVSNLSCPNFNFIVCVEVYISIKELHTRKDFQGKACDPIYDVIIDPTYQSVSQYKFPTNIGSGISGMK